MDKLNVHYANEKPLPLKGTVILEVYLSTNKGKLFTWQIT